MQRDIAENSAAHRQIDNANEDQNVGTEALNKGVETAENAAGVVRQNLYSRKLQRNMTQ